MITLHIPQQCIVLLITSMLSYLHVSTILQWTGCLIFTEVTQKRISVIVSSHVCSQCGLVVEGLGAELASVGPNLAVLDHVLLKHLA